jgi:hypothetical protein
VCGFRKPRYLLRRFPKAIEVQCAPLDGHDGPHAGTTGSLSREPTISTSTELAAPTATPPPDVRRTRQWTGLALLSPAVVTLLLIAVIPTALVIRNSFAIADNYGGIVGGFTLDNYRGLADPVYLKVLATASPLPESTPSSVSWSDTSARVTSCPARRGGKH